MKYVGERNSQRILTDFARLTGLAAPFARLRPPCGLGCAVCPASFRPLFAVSTASFARLRFGRFAASTTPFARLRFGRFAASTTPFARLRFGRFAASTTPWHFFKRRGRGFWPRPLRLKKWWSSCRKTQKVSVPIVILMNLP